mmetsp:Transcript_4809/g.17311  ORF Transcript_4809/g.17311 Transcript_4809/m.17311 type:complete len:209 (+) Transcript_4809:141-767(+)
MGIFKVVRVVALSPVKITTVLALRMFAPTAAWRTVCLFAAAGRVKYLKWEVLSIGAAGPLLEVISPMTSRSLMFYNQIAPMFVGYVRTVWFDAAMKQKKFLGINLPLRKSKLVNETQAEKIWAARHRKGAQQLCAALEKLSGFYLKVGQVFAAKADILPQQYVEEMSKLFDMLEPAPFKEMRRVVEKEWGKDLYSVGPGPLCVQNFFL